jgi:hypothetical protein
LLHSDQLCLDRIQPHHDFLALEAHREVPGTAEGPKALAHGVQLFQAELNLHSYGGSIG